MPRSETARSPFPGKRMRREFWRWLYLTHRWVGIASCLLFTIWFASGLVMLYVPYPALSMKATLAGATPIDWSHVAQPPRWTDDGRTPRRIELRMRDGEPMWRIERWHGEPLLFSARTGAKPAALDAAQAMRIAGAFGHAAIAQATRIERDQWTVAGGFDADRPLWKVRLADGQGTWLYVSSHDGEVVQSVTRWQRFWNWLGAIPHWIYPTILRQHAAAWRQVVLWVSGPCIAVALTGTWIGILRMRLGKGRYRDGRASPYRGWMLWHHLAGLTGGFFLVTWIFSGWLSVDPGRMFGAQALPEGAQQVYETPAQQPSLDLAALALRAEGHGVRLVQITFASGYPVAAFYGGNGDRRLYRLPDLAPANPPRTQITEAASRLLGDARLTQATLLQQPDAFWYDLDGTPQLPVLRLCFDDPGTTWLYVDPRTGQILERLSKRQRIYRWLYDLLHRWDPGLLVRHPLWREALIWLASLGGLIVSTSGVRLAWSRLRTTHLRRARQG